MTSASALGGSSLKAENSTDRLREYEGVKGEGVTLNRVWGVDVIYDVPLSHQCINVVGSFVAHASRPRSRSSSSSSNRLRMAPVSIGDSRAMVVA